MTHDEKDGGGEQHHQKRPEAAGRERHLGPRLSGADAGHPHEPGRREVGQPGRTLGQRQADGREHGSQDPEHGGRPHRGDRKQVGGHREQADLPRDRHDDRPAGHLRCGRDREGVGAPSRRPAREPCLQLLPPGRGQQEQPRGGQCGQREAGRGGELGREQEQDEHRRGQCWQRLPPGPGCQRDQSDAAHDRGPKHVRRRPGEHHESEQDQRGGRGPPAQPDAQPAADHQRRSEDDRDVGAGQRLRRGWLATLLLGSVPAELFLVRQAVVDHRRSGHGRDV